MSRGQGRVFRPKDTVFWWLDYTVGGKRHRESSGMTKRKDALGVLRQRTGDRESGKLTGSPGKVTLGDLKGFVERQYALDGRRSLERAQDAYAHLVGFFGAECRAVDISRTRIDAYATQRLASGRARATVNQELAQLRRGFKLALDAGALAVMPAFKLPNPHNARSGFFEDGAFAAVLLELPPEERDLVTFLRATGWRRDEGRLLAWAEVDLDGGTLRLGQGRSKSGRSRVFPFGLAPSLAALLAERWAQRNGLYVFHVDGEPIGKSTLRTTWARAVKRAGVPDRLLHDLRRSAARDFRRAGVSEGEIMALCGWETRSMFDRYNIIDEGDLAAAVARRFTPPESCGIDTAKKVPHAGEAAP